MGEEIAAAQSSTQEAKQTLSRHPVMAARLAVQAKPDAQLSPGTPRPRGIAPHRRQNLDPVRP
ncbi:MAG: hypothetical protein IH793_10155 [Acidobacteria bacterium]|nr:hypothetical protein [Acidobacteriota bacterium]